MSDYGTLKSRIADELNRSDLMSQIGSTILRSIEHFAKQRFLFNEGKGTATTTSGNQYVDLPSGLRIIDDVYATVGGYTYDLTKQEFDALEYWHGASQTSGQPLDYAVRKNQVRIYPEPNEAYVLTFTGIFDEPALSDDADTNDWCTGAAQDLIVADVKYRIARDVIYDEEVMRNALIARKEALMDLRGTTHAQVADGKLQASW